MLEVIDLGGLGGEFARSFRELGADRGESVSTGKITGPTAVVLDAKNRSTQAFGLAPKSYDQGYKPVPPPPPFPTAPPSRYPLTPVLVALKVYEFCDSLYDAATAAAQRADTAFSGHPNLPRFRRSNGYWYAAMRTVFATVNVPLLMIQNPTQVLHPLSAKLFWDACQFYTEEIDATTTAAGVSPSWGDAVSAAAGELPGRISYVVGLVARGATQVTVEVAKDATSIAAGIAAGTVKGFLLGLGPILSTVLVGGAAWLGYRVFFQKKPVPEGVRKAGRIAKAAARRVGRAATAASRVKVA